METMIEMYDYLFKDLADPRVYDWPFMADPFAILGVIMLYLYGIYVYLPSYMKNREPYNLKGVIIIYNVFQIIMCTTIFYGVATSGWTTHYTLGCQLVEYSEGSMASYMWLATMSKLVDLIETVLFALRKKFSQISALHVFHHVSTVVIGWVLSKYIPGGMSSFSALLNSFVHVTMYTYYLLASLGPEMQKKLRVVKSKLTLLQIIHISLMAVHSLQSLLPSCKFPSLLAFTLVLPLLINLYFFRMFYRENYVKKKNQE